MSANASQAPPRTPQPTAKDVGMSFGRFVIALTIVMSALALVKAIDDKSAWLFVFIVLLSMVIGVNGKPEVFVQAIADFITNALGV